MCVFLINRKEAKWYEIYLGEIKLIDRLTSDVPKQVKKAVLKATNQRESNGILKPDFSNISKSQVKKPSRS